MILSLFKYESPINIAKKNFYSPHGADQLSLVKALMYTLCSTSPKYNQAVNKQKLFGHVETHLVSSNVLTGQKFVHVKIFGKNQTSAEQTHLYL